MSGANPLQDHNSNPSSIDKSLGSRLRTKRESTGFSREQLAQKLQIDPEDINAYENGAKRISALRLLQLFEALAVQPTYFFGLSRERQRRATEDGGRPNAGAGVYLTLLDQGVRLNRAFVGIKNPDLREAIVTLVIELTKSDDAR